MSIVVLPDRSPRADAPPPVAFLRELLRHNDDPDAARSMLLKLADSYSAAC